jgi:hypothetical protein
MVLPALQDSFLVILWFVVGTDRHYNFSIMRSPIELRFGVDYGLVSQISIHVLVLRFDYLLFCKQTNKQKSTKIVKNTVLENFSFLWRSKSN